MYFTQKPFTIFLSVFVSSLFSLSVLATSVDVNDVDTGGAEETTIRITKGKQAEAVTTSASGWEVIDGTNEVEGEEMPMRRAAKKSWKQACKDWKKEFRADNKDSKIININCGSVSCGGNAGSKVCKSTATYKIKSKVE